MASVAGGMRNKCALDIALSQLLLMANMALYAAAAHKGPGRIQVTWHGVHTGDMAWGAYRCRVHTTKHMHKGPGCIQVSRACAWGAYRCRAH